MACQSRLECGEGSKEVAGQCVAVLSPTCGEGTVLKKGRCVPTQGGGELPCGPGTHADEGECVLDIKPLPNSARVVSMQFLAPDALKIHNDVLTEAYRSGKHLLFLGAHTPASGVLRVFGGVGRRTDENSLVDDTYTLLGDLAFEANTSPLASGFQSEAIDLSIPLIADKPIALVKATITNGRVEKSGDTLHFSRVVRGGELAGIVTRAHARTLHVGNQTFEELLTSLGVMPDVDHEPPDDGVKDSFTLSLKFECEDARLILPVP
jgi:hypothetical protein